MCKRQETWAAPESRELGEQGVHPGKADGPCRGGGHCPQAHRDGLGARGSHTSTGLVQTARHGGKASIKCSRREAGKAGNSSLNLNMVGGLMKGNGFELAPLKRRKFKMSKEYTSGAE